jgi:predicted adenylyl cyclase CyaB
VVPGRLLAVLARALGQLGTVKKTRWLYVAGQTRVHIDEVDGLGWFIELEVVLRPGQNDCEGHAIIQDFMRELGIREILPTAYIDLLSGG